MITRVIPTKRKAWKENQKIDTTESLNTPYNGRTKVLIACRSGIFPLPSIECTGHPPNLASHLKILTPKQMLQRLLITLAQVKAGKTSENLLNELLQIISSMYWVKEITKKVCNNTMNSIKLKNRIDSVFIGTKNSKSPAPHRLIY